MYVDIRESCSEWSGTDRKGRNSPWMWAESIGGIVTGGSARDGRGIALPGALDFRRADFPSAQANSSTLWEFQRALVEEEHDEDSQSQRRWWCGTQRG